MTTKDDWNDWNDWLPIPEPWEKWIANKGIKLTIKERQPLETAA